MQTINPTSSLSISVKQRLQQFCTILLLIGCTSLLTVHTLDLQHSCHPLLEWSEISSQQCPSSEDPKPDRSDKDGGSKDQTDDKKVVYKSDKREPGKFKNELGSIAIGSVTVAGLAIAGAPVAIVAGVGFVVWIAARTLISINH